MKIIDLELKTANGRKRFSAMVCWENQDRPPMEIFFETDESYAAGMDGCGDAFLTACILPALRHGEERLYIDAAVSLEIKQGLMDAQGWIKSWWYPADKTSVRIESNDVILDPSNVAAPRAGMFFSGGVDSLASLRSNRLNYPTDHPLSVKDGFIVFGLETDQNEKFAHVLSALRPIAKDAEIELIPVYTNIRYLDADWMFWEREFEDAVFAAISHTFTHRLTVVSIASTYDIPNMQRCGTHPLLDIAYSTYRLRILHDNITFNRMDKLRLLADWPVALDHMRVCNRSDVYRQGMVNCGECWKCVKTRLALLCLGVAQPVGAFPDIEITRDLVESTCQIYITTACWWEELIDPLKSIGREDLAVVIERKIDRYLRQMEKAKLKQGVGKIIKRYDQKYLNGTLRAFFQRMNARKRQPSN